MYIQRRADWRDLWTLHDNMSASRYLRRHWPHERAPLPSCYLIDWAAGSGAGGYVYHDFPASTTDPVIVVAICRGREGCIPSPDRTQERAVP